MNIIDTITPWRDEISTRLTAATPELQAAQAEHDGAAEALGIAEGLYQAAQAALLAIDERLIASRSGAQSWSPGLRKLSSDAGPSPLLTRRVRWLEDERNAARTRQARIASQLATLRDQIQELESALAQIDLVLRPAIEEVG